MGPPKKYLYVYTPPCVLISTTTVWSRVTITIVAVRSLANNCTAFGSSGFVFIQATAGGLSLEARGLPGFSVAGGERGERNTDQVKLFLRHRLEVVLIVLRSPKRSTTTTATTAVARSSTQGKRSEAAEAGTGTKRNVTGLNSQRNKIKPREA